MFRKQRIAPIAETLQSSSVPVVDSIVSNCMLLSIGLMMPDRFEQAFGVVAASIGLASFALVLALVEQIVLEVIESNVKTGSAVYETGHVRLSPLVNQPATLSF